MERVLGQLSLALVEHIRATGATQEQLLQESIEYFRGIADASPGVIWLTDPAGECIFVNHRWTEITGQDGQAAQGMGWLDRVHPEDRPAVERSFAEANAVKGCFRAEYRLLREDTDEVCWALDTASPRFSASNEYLGYIGAVTDVTERRLAEERALFLAYHDPLTGLANRRLLRDRLANDLAALRPGAGLALLCLDLDHFKAINDTLGHPAGDALLCEAAERLRSCAGPRDLVARLGGDEFAILAATEGEGRPEASLLAERALEALRRPYFLRGQPYVVSTSIGAVLAPRDGMLPDELVRHADIALYRAKRDGRDAARFFDCAMAEEAERRHGLRRSLTSALERNELSLRFQPLRRLSDRSVTGFEALLRWIPAGQKAVPPAEFIPLAEESGVIIPIGEWVLRQACQAAALWPDDVRVAVNLSPVQFRSPCLLAAVQEALADASLAPDRLELEVTESVLLQEDQANLDILCRLRGLGVRIVLDDFGTGYSSLAYLLRAPFDKIKVDRSFVAGLPGRRESKAIICAIAGLGRSLEIAVTAEGVETEAQLQTVGEMGCSEAQGALVGSPMTAGEAGALLAGMLSVA
ncbi:putative bifunctional diguanylate cyclase/phosphodiesterase [Sabulicella rubraurantiaca]|uniref:putative bifunctional diguanylate cyclase/phosphodiesterase n=1 Tax=Sabulicella rubraurantiaca TaxID=2811429 RepID=UPI001A9731FB|nr:EAL domain-containing protein [Sabulicella rubraurantiaca]